MTSFTLVTLLIVWGFFALIATVLVLLGWFALSTLGIDVVRHIRPVRAIVLRIGESLRPVLLRLRERARIAVQSFAPTSP